MNWTYLLRTSVSALVVGAVAVGDTLQTAMTSGQPVTKWQVWSAILGGAVLMLNDVKSRLTPTESVQTASGQT